ncbi:kinase-like protein [Byssothecium circinans]|uniref:Kinase-like protein n=1 Tax=Byssothecium circinans TaxID=147558 RepID=A0A6A5U3B3_9PLEO|nr:kinase-like protein [Byssothecium circinans]
MTPSHIKLTLLRRDGSALRDPILSQGKIGVVVRRDDAALKLPLKYSTTGLSKADIKLYDIYFDISCEALQREKEVYRRLGPSRGIVPCIDLSGDGIQMALMTNGNLQDYLRLPRYHPERSTQLAWFRDMADTLARIHDRRVIVADIATRNFLLTDDLSVRFSDFTESTILPLDTDIETVDDHGYSIYTDIGQLGAVMYEIITGSHCDFDLFKDQPPGPARAIWPKREDLPSTHGLWLRSIIDACWTRSFKSAHELSDRLNSVTLE